jgi:hypothetical protein
VTRSSESTAWKWMRFDRLVRSVVDFRKPVYRRLHERFKPHLAGSAASPRRAAVRPARVSAARR